MRDVVIKKRNIGTAILWAVFLGLIYLRYVIQIDFPRIILMAVFSMLVLKGNKEEILGLCACCIPFDTSFHSYYAILICLIVYLIKYGKEMRFGIGIFPVLMIWLWEILHGFSGDFSIKDNITFILPYILCLFVMYSDIGEVNYKKIMKTLALCTVFMCFVVLSKLLIVSGFQIKGMFLNMQRLGSIYGVEESGAYFNPNALGYFCILSSTGLIQTILSEKGKKIDYLMISVLIIFGLMTMSKTYLVCLITMILLFIFVKNEKKYNKIKFIGYILFAGIAIAIILQTVFPNVLESIVKRLNVNDISSGRMTLFEKYNEYIFYSTENLFFGTGLTGMDGKIKSYFMTPINVPHNGLQEILVVWGIIGLILFFAFLYCLVKKSIKVYKNQSLINYIPLILLLLKVQAGQLVTSFYTMLMFMLAYLSLCCDFREKESISELKQYKSKLDN